MKTKITLLAIAACAAIQAVALAGQPPKAPVTQNQLNASKTVTPATATTSTTTPVKKPVIITPLNKSLPVQKTDIYRVGKVSSRAWTESVGWNPGTPSMAYDSGGGKEQGLTLFWIGSEPSR